MNAEQQAKNDRRKAEMIRLRDIEHKTLQEIADIYCITRERVRQIIGNTGHRGYRKKK